ESIRAVDTHGWGHPRSSSSATRLVAVGSGQVRDHAKTPPDFNTPLTVFSTWGMIGNGAPKPRLNPQVTSWKLLVQSDHRQGARKPCAPCKPSRANSQHYTNCQGSRNVKLLA